MAKPNDYEYAQLNSSKVWEEGGTRPFHRIDVPLDIFRKATDTADNGKQVDDTPISGWAFRCGCQDPDHDAANSTTWEYIKDGLVGGLLGAAVLGLVGAGLGALGSAAGAGGQGWLVAALAGGGALFGAMIGGGGADGTGGSLKNAALGALAGGGAGALLGGALIGGPLISGLTGAAIGLVGGAIGYAALKNSVCKKLVRTIPGWVHAENTRENKKALDAEKERELEGKLTGSYQTWTDVPLFQYHRYFDWNFHLEADPGFGYVGSRGGLHEEEENSDTKQPDIECEWDTGAFSGIPGDETNPNDDKPGACPDYHGAIFRDPQSSQEKDRLLWPMTGQRCWLSGRWIYDCGHGRVSKTFEALSDDDKKKDENFFPSQRFRSELHPVKAMSFTQWEGVLFETENNNKYVRGARFVFFASRIGGYYRFKDLKAKDYTFVVDLPPHPYASELSYTVESHPSYDGCSIAKATSNSSHATASVDEGPTPLAGRSTELLLRINTNPFNAMRGKKATAVKPVVVPVGPATGSGLPNQVKVTIPLTAAAGDDDCYGVIIDLAWKDDPAHTLANDVYKYTVRFDKVKKLDVSHNPEGDLPSIEGPNEEWRVRFGVNGRWGETEQKDMKPNYELPLNKSFTIYLHKDDQLIVNAHGTELDSVEDLFSKSKEDRQICVDGQPVNYDVDFVRADPDRRREVAREIFGMMFWTFSDTSDPLGRFDQTYTNVGREFAPPGSYPGPDKNAVALIENHRLAETEKDPAGSVDYEIIFGVEAATQFA